MSAPSSNGPLRLGTRKSALAMAQSGRAARDLEAANPGVSVELVPIVTTGDRLKGSLAKHGGKGLFTQELEQGLADGSLDLAVHSLKDLPVEGPEGLPVVAHPRRADPRDVLVSEVAESLDDLPEGAELLTGSLRRSALLLAHRPDLRIVPIRGNVDTRLRKWRDSGAAGVILAAAGLYRLGIQGVPIRPLDPDVMIPAAGQGALALQVRAGGRADEPCRRLNHIPTARAVAAERAVVAAFGADCTLPLAAWASPTDPGDEDGEGLRLIALLGTPDGRRVARGEAEGNDPAAVAAACVAVMREHGADEILERVRREAGEPERRPTDR